MATSLTILVPTHNRPEVLDQTWPSWLRQEGLKEIVLVNDGSNCSYVNVLKNLEAACNAQNVNLKVITTAVRVGAPAAKNRGLAECTSEEILTTDDDIELPAEMVATCRKHQASETRPTIYGPRVIYQKTKENQSDALMRAAKETKPFFDYQRLILTPWANADQLEEVPFVTAVALWPASLFNDGLRFFENYRGNGYREETDPQLVAAEEYGASIKFVPDAYCFHLPPDIAYAEEGGQRRGGRFWFEYWVLKNNFIFLRRHGAYLKREFGTSSLFCWIRLATARFSPSRLLRAFSKLK